MFARPGLTRRPFEMGSVMTVSARHLLEQGHNLAGLVRAGVGAVRSRGKKGGAYPTPGPLVSADVAPPSDRLVHDYLVWTGGDPRAWQGQLPTHLFPMWCFAWMGRTLEGVPYDVSKVLNGGCTVHANRPIPAGERLQVTAQLTGLDDDERRVLFHQRVTTSTASAPDALVVDIRLILPKRSKDKSKDKAPSAPATVPVTARQVAEWRLPANAGLDFALLTGDFNPIHWIPPAGRAAGFGGCILHGYATMARSVEGVLASQLAGRIDGMSSFDVRFARPVKLPGKVGLFVDGTGAQGGDFFVGGAPGAPANLIGSYVRREA